MKLSDHASHTFVSKNLYEIHDHAPTYVEKRKKRKEKKT